MLQNRRRAKQERLDDQRICDMFVFFMHYILFVETKGVWKGVSAFEIKSKPVLFHNNTPVLGTKPKQRRRGSQACKYKREKNEIPLYTLYFTASQGRSTDGLWLC